VLRGVVPDVVTDQTPAHDALMYVPAGLSVGEAEALRAGNPAEYVQRSMRSMAQHVEAMLEFQKRGAEVFDYGNNLRQRAYDHGVREAFNFPGFVPAYIRPCFAKAKDLSAGWRSPGSARYLHTDQAVMELFPRTSTCTAGCAWHAQKVPFQGLPARICWLGYGERAAAGLKFNQLVATGAVKAPIVIGRDHLDAGSVASPNRRRKVCWTGAIPSATGPFSTP